MKEKIEKWYRQGLWSANRVKDAVAKGFLTQEEYEEIVKQGGET